MVQIAKVNMVTSSGAALAVAKKKKENEEFTTSEEYILNTDIGESGVYLSTAGERYMQAGESEID